MTMRRVSLALPPSMRSVPPYLPGVLLGALVADDRRDARGCARRPAAARRPATAASKNGGSTIAGSACAERRMREQRRKRKSAGKPQNCPNAHPALPFVLSLGNRR